VVTQPICALTPEKIDLSLKQHGANADEFCQLCRLHRLFIEFAFAVRIVEAEPYGAWSIENQYRSVLSGFQIEL